MQPEGTQSAEETRSLSPYGVLLGLWVLGGLVFGQVVGFEFVWDDTNLIKANGWLDRTETLWLVFNHDFWGLTNSPKDSGMYRPLVLLSYWLEVRLWGRTPAGFHAVNLALHLLNTTLLWALLRRLNVGDVAAGLAAALFLVHPVQVEAVGNIASRTDVMASGFTLAALWCWLHASETRGWWRVMGCCWMGLGLLCKESVIFGPLLMVVAASFVNPPEEEHSPQREPWWIRLAPLGLWALYIPLRIAVFGSSPFGGISGDAAHWQGGAVVFLYLGRLFLPFPQPPIVELEAPELWWAVGSLILLGVGIALVWWRATDQRLRLAVVFMALTLAPVSQLLPMSVRFSDLLLYLPCAGFALGVGVLLSSRRTQTQAAFLAVLVVLAWLSCSRVGHWKDNLSLWSFALSLDPTEPTANMNFANALRHSGQTQQGCRALEHTLVVLQQRPNADIASKTHYNLGNCLFHAHQWPDAVVHYQKALSIRYIKHARDNTVLALLEMGRFDEAQTQARELIRVHPRSGRAWELLGIVQGRSGRFAEAKESFAKAVSLEPQDARYQALLKEAQQALERSKANKAPP